MGSMCVIEHQKLDERGIKYKRMLSNSEEYQGTHRAILPTTGDAMTQETHVDFPNIKLMPPSVERIRW